MASPDELLAMLEEAAGEAEHGITQEQLEEDEEEDSYQEVLDDWMEELLDEISLGLCFEVHRSCKIGIFLLDDTDKESEKKYEIVKEKAVDVFGQVPMKKQLECVCPNCQRNLAASRFAPHLEKCMGMGRNSSRIASRRIANSGKKEESENESEENNEDDWTYMADRKGSGSRAKKIKRDRRHDSPRRNKSSKKTSAGDNGGDHSFTPAYEALTVEDRKALLLQTCGVISEHTKKMCTRSHRCPQHSDDQRRAVRVYLLGGGVDNDDIHVDIDSYEDGDTQALRDSLQWEATSNPSPADSTSTTNSTSSRKKKSSRSSKKKSGNNKTPSAGTPSSLYDFV